MAERYRYNVDPLSDTAAANVLRFVGRDRSVLEIGAGPGSIARPLVELNNARLTALEIDPSSVEILKQFCKRVIQHDLHDPAWPDVVGNTRFDAVVIADVLEHLNDPWNTLQQAAGLLNEDGRLVVSIPHAAHAVMLACLLNGDFRYEEWGLLDRTHIRFFAMKNIQALFDHAGLKIIDYAYVLRAPAQTELADLWSKLPASVAGVLEESEFAHVYQVVVKAIRTSAEPARSGYVLPNEPAPKANPLKLVAFYLTQFHPIPENDAWWGKGFTEWTNTASAMPQFPGHYQPHQPADFGFYDLRLRESQREQIAHAKRFGIDAFCFHYYWFNGRRLLERPLFDFLADEGAQIQFCLSWANENWTRKWDASEHEVLMQQTYSPENDIEFIKGLLQFFADRRYLRVEGKPLLLVYRLQHMPEPRVTVERWRDFCRLNGVGEIHIVACLSHGNADFEQFGVDAGVEFPPSLITAPNLNAQIPSMDDRSYVVEFREVASDSLKRDYAKRRVYRTVFPSWDNTARFGNRGLVVLDGNPSNYERWLDGAAARTLAERAPGDQLLFINAWNEWAEGCHLEPDQRHGLGFLEATKRVKDRRSMIDPVFPPTVLPDFPTATLSSQPSIAPAVAESVSYGLRTELGMWGVRAFRRFPLAYRIARRFYRMTMRRR